ncbi:Eukaryotic translation initiation factor 3 subunit D [Chytridiales sp. JEL 0842]|nr:Eukaryotic translation initiation factor 3 subunit D [Chytridiales sp. JEL 0842]
MVPTSTSEDKPVFNLPAIEDNPNGWGPSKIPHSLTQIPYAPFSKSDRIGKIADWSAPLEDAQQQQQDGRGQSRRNMRFGAPAEVFGSGTASAFAFSFAAEEEASFSVVDRASAAKKPGSLGGAGGFRSRGGGRGGGPRTNIGGLTRGLGGANAKGQQQGGGRGGFAAGGFGRRRFGFNDKPQRIRDASVQAGPEWKIIEEIDFGRLSKLYYEVEEPEDVGVYGTINFYDKSYDRVSTKFEKPLQTFDRHFVNKTSSEDVVLKDLAKSATNPVVLATDNILSTLMCAGKSVYSWDIIITKAGDRITFDKRDDGNFDIFHVNENASEAPLEGEKDSINTPAALAEEATYILRNYTQQCLKENEQYVFQNPNPFESEAKEFPLPSVAYRYRKWNLGDDIELYVRTTLEAAVHAPGSMASREVPEALEPLNSAAPPSEVLFVTSKTLNEFDSRAPGAGGAPEWRQKLDAQRGAVMATEIKNNGNKLARWATEALLAGADQMRLGFVSRAVPKDRQKHVVLGSAFFKPKEFAGQMNLNIANGWGILKAIVDLVRSMDDGKYVMVKDPNKSMVRLYSVPANTFEGGDESQAVESTA